MQIFDHIIGFWEKRLFFAENCQKSQKIVIITSTPGHPDSDKNGLFPNKARKARECRAGLGLQTQGSGFLCQYHIY
jgi:hypothetical protein